MTRSQDTDERLSAGQTGGFAPLSDELAPEVREFVEFLRILMKKIGLGVRQYAAYRHLSASSVSRYLSGERVPDKSFIDTLMDSYGRHTGVPVPDEARARAYALHLEALRAAQPARWKVQMLTDELEHALHARLAAEAEVRRLRSGVSGREQRIEELEARIGEWGQVNGRDNAALVRHQERIRELEAECERLRAQISRLKHDLRAAERAHKDAEARCVQLEAELTTLEERAEAERLEQERDGLLATAPAELARAHAQLTRAREELDRAHAEADSVTRQAWSLADAQHKDIEKLRRKASMLRAEIKDMASLKNEYAATEARCAYLETEVNKLRYTIHSLKSWDDDFGPAMASWNGMTTSRLYGSQPSQAG